MAIAGIRGTGDWGADERPKNFRELILWRNPNGTAPLTALLGKMRSEAVDDPEFNWWEEELNALRLRTNFTTGYSTTDTAMAIIGDAQLAVPGDVFLRESAITTSYANEVLIVSSVTDEFNIVFRRGQAGTTASPIPNNTFLTKIGNVYAEGSGSPVASTRNPTKLFNYCQIFKTSYEITNTAKLTRARTGDPLKNDKKRKMFDHSTAMEMAFFFGKRFEGAGENGKPLRLTGGILHMLSQYASSRITAFTTTPTENTFLDAIYPMFDYDTEAGNERIGFCGNGALNSLNKLAANASRTRVNYDGVVKLYGMDLQRWILPQGSVYLRTHPLFNTHGRFTNDMFFFDPSVIKYRYLRDTKMEDNIQLPGSDTQKGQWLTEAGLELEHAKTCSWVSNFVV